MATQLPHNLEAEQQVLGSVLIGDDSVLPTVAATITSADFYAERHRAIFEAMLENKRNGKPLDFVSLGATLKQQGADGASGGVVYLIELVDLVATTLTTGYYVKQVRDLSLARTLYRSLMQVAQDACTPGVDITETIAAGYAALEGVSQKRHGSGGAILTLTDMAQLYSNHVSNSGKNRFKTGFDGLDAVITGVSPGEVLTVVAYSGLGKSAFLHNLLLDGCRRSGLHHIFFSLEMPATRVFERTVQIALGRYTYNIESEFHHHNADKQVLTMMDLATSNANKLLCCEQGGLSLEKIEHYTRLAQSKHGKIGAIGIDYLGLMSAPGTKGEYERISTAAEGAKHLAKRLNIPVIMLCQISREAAKLGKTEMHSAKGSGAVEASADYMISLERTRDGLILAKVLKNRNGEADITFQADITWPFLKFNSLLPYDDKAQKNIERGKNRKAKGGWQDEKDDDPY